MTIPNLITLARLVAVPLILYLTLTDAAGWAFLVFVAAGVSDAVDGIIARHVPGQASELGRLLDPIADKALIVTLFLALALRGDVPVWLALLVTGRDLLIVVGVLVASLVGRPVPIVPLPVSKANTALQIVYVAGTLGDLGLGLGLEPAVDCAGYIVAVLTVVSAVAYLRAWLGRVAGQSGG